MGDKLLTLEEWAETVYGSRRPAVVTLRRWAREARIYPPPEKHGRTYFVLVSARYLDPRKPIPAPANDSARSIRSPLVERVRGKTA